MGQLNSQNAESKIIIVNNTNVIIDRDVAEIYGVETRDINKAVKNNLDKIPEGYYFELTNNKKDELVENFHHLNSLKHSKANPKAFTEKGLLYVSNNIKKSTSYSNNTLICVFPLKGERKKRQ